MRDVQRRAALDGAHAQRAARRDESSCVVCDSARARCADRCLPSLGRAHLQRGNHREALLRALHQRRAKLRQELPVGDQTFKGDFGLVRQRLRRKLRQPEPGVCLACARTSQRAQTRRAGLCCTRTFSASAVKRLKSSCCTSCLLSALESLAELSPIAGSTRLRAAERSKDYEPRQRPGRASGTEPGPVPVGRILRRPATCARC